MVTLAWTLSVSPDQGEIVVDVTSTKSNPDVRATAYTATDYCVNELLKYTVSGIIGNDWQR